MIPPARPSAPNRSWERPGHCALRRRPQQKTSPPLSRHPVLLDRVYATQTYLISLAVLLREPYSPVMHLPSTPARWTDSLPYTIQQPAWLPLPDWPPLYRSRSEERRVGKE